MSIEERYPINSQWRPPTAWGFPSNNIATVIDHVRWKDEWYAVLGWEVGGPNVLSLGSLEKLIRVVPEPWLKPGDRVWYYGNGDIYTVHASWVSPDGRIGFVTTSNPWTTRTLECWERVRESNV